MTDNEINHLEEELRKLAMLAGPTHQCVGDTARSFLELYDKFNANADDALKRLNEMQKLRDSRFSVDPLAEATYRLLLRTIDRLYLHVKEAMDGGG